MKANELMIGDLIYEGSDHQIKISANYGRSVRYIEGKYTHEVEETYLNPIPLTEDILKANGWTSTGCGWYEHANRLNVYVNNDSYGIFYNNLTGIKYVHELQHALRLCGLNELADNFKIE